MSTTAILTEWFCICWLLTTKAIWFQFSSVTQLCPTLCDPMDCSTPGFPVHPSPTPRACLNSYPLSYWCHPTISSLVVRFSSCLQSFPALGSFPMSQFFISGGQSIRVSASASLLPMNTQGLISFKMDWLDLFAVQGIFKSLLQHHSSKASILWHSAFFMSNSHIHTWLLEKQ